MDELNAMLHAILPAFSRLTLTLEPPAAIVALNHPPVNVIDTAMCDELVRVIAHVNSRSDVSLVVLTSEGENFSAGVDIKAHTPERVREMLTRFHAAVRALAATSKVTVASVRGNCLGGGAELALLCDLVYTTEDSRWGFPEINLASFPPVAAVALRHAVGEKRAAELILTGNIIDGDQAFAIGMANDAVPHNELDDLIQEVAQRLASLSPAALALTKKAFYSSREFEQSLEKTESIYLNELAQTEDCAEGVAAWIEKREARWKGR